MSVKNERGREIQYACSMTPLGLVLIAATDRGICFLQFGESVEGLLEELKGEFPKGAIIPASHETHLRFNDWMAMIRAYLGQKQMLEQLPLDLSGTPFQLLVWNHLQRIPVGTMESYAQVARAIGKPKAVRAVGSACAKNRIAMLIPCHRVVRSNGAISSYRWNPDRKKILLTLEREFSLHTDTAYMCEPGAETQKALTSPEKLASAFCSAYRI